MLRVKCIGDRASLRNNEGVELGLRLGSEIFPAVNTSV